jgi:hypothetical protein
LSIWTWFGLSSQYLVKWLIYSFLSIVKNYLINGNGENCCIHNSDKNKNTLK